MYKVFLVALRELKERVDIRILVIVVQFVVMCTLFASMFFARRFKIIYK
jgi:hypothetical protein